MQNFHTMYQRLYSARLATDLADSLKEQHQYHLGELDCSEKKNQIEGDKSTVTSTWAIHKGTLCLECKMETVLKTMGNSNIPVKPQLNSFFNIEGMKMNKQIVKTIKHQSICQTFIWRTKPIG